MTTPPTTPWLLLAPLAGFVLLLPFGRTAEAAVLAALLIAGTLAARERSRWLPLTGPLLAFLLLLWCYVQPALISAFDSLDPAKSWQTALTALRYAGLGAVAVLWYARAPKPERLTQAVGLLLAVWVLDALVQALTGVGLRGTSAPDRLSGIFGADNLKLGITLVALAPVAVAAAALYGRAAATAAALLLLLVLLLSGARAAWVSAAVLTAVGVHLLLGSRWRRTLPALGGLALLGAGAVAGLAQLSPVFAERLARTTTGFALDRAAIDYALADRLPIFEAAARMAAAHPVNGVGVRAFQEAYPTHTVPGDKWLLMGDGRGAAHAHHLVLEVAAETGAIGLICWLLGVGLLWRYWHDADAEQRRRALPWLLGLLAMTFPINTHLAFYSAYWSGVLFWLLALASAALLVPVRDAGADAGADDGR